MSFNILRPCWGVVVMALLALGAQFARANSAPVFSGSYEVLNDTTLGSQAQIRVHIHLVNNGQSDFAVQRITLWDFSHAEKGRSHACAVTLRAHAAADTTQEFTIRRSEYQLWQRGMQPRLVLRMAGAGGNKNSAVVRLGLMSRREAK